MGCDCTRPKSFHPDWCSLRNHWWCAPRRSSELGVSASPIAKSPKDELTKLQYVSSGKSYLRSWHWYPRHCMPHVSLRTVTTKQARMASWTSRNLPCLRIHALWMAWLCMLLRNRQKPFFRLEIPALRAVLVAACPAHHQHLDPEIATMAAPERDGGTSMEGSQGSEEIS